MMPQRMTYRVWGITSNEALGVLFYPMVQSKLGTSSIFFPTSPASHLTLTGHKCADKTCPDVSHILS